MSYNSFMQPIMASELVALLKEKDEDKRGLSYSYNNFHDDIKYKLFDIAASTLVRALRYPLERNT